ncbi:hypothetical protein TPA0910_05630 [Streptomyces hygroscopicus subsp. sporocinereus]|uniref:Uncharacterized protein n=1 Tax=Streptomyces hygroscopicus TaxID=1912 RepID=A0ABQ3TS21_STRHY|nr:hypothetical protein TPA0910_05630 [Streptomyces hygroscopicus]
MEPEVRSHHDSEHVTGLDMTCGFHRTRPLTGPGRVAARPAGITPRLPGPVARLISGPRTRPVSAAASDRRTGARRSGGAGPRPGRTAGGSAARPHCADRDTPA